MIVAYPFWEAQIRAKPAKYVDDNAMYLNKYMALFYNSSQNIDLTVTKTC